MWAWGADQHTRFWPRRMLHETLVHRTDAALALGQDPHPTIDPEVAADGIDELFANLPSAAAFSPDVLDIKGSGSFGIVGNDTGVEWVVDPPRRRLRRLPGRPGRGEGGRRAADRLHPRAAARPLPARDHPGRRRHRGR